MRPIALTLFAATCLPVGFDPAPPPKRPLYFPVTVGTEWVLMMDEQRFVRRVTAVVETGREWRVTVERTENGDREMMETEQWLVTGEGLWMDSLYVGVRDLRLQYPPIAGSRWVVRKPTGDVTEGAVWRENEIVAVERVRLPGGEAEAVRVDEIMMHQFGRKRQEVERKSFWYSPGYGIIRESLGGNFVWELTAFETGK